MSSFYQVGDARLGFGEFGNGRGGCRIGRKVIIGENLRGFALILFLLFRATRGVG